MYTVYYIFICHISFDCIYESTPDYIPIYYSSIADLVVVCIV